MASTEDIQHMANLGLESAQDALFYYHRGLSSPQSTSPIIVLIHGYPQSNFMWRHLIPLLPTSIPLFIPDIPGYGRSKSLTKPHSKLNQGAAIIDQLSSHLKSDSKHTLIIVGHDRGARICHRLAVDASAYAKFPILGAILLDIVPTLVQWQSFAEAKASSGTFHWPFLANVEIASKMIAAQGGGIWAKTCIYRWAGKSESGLKNLEADGAVEVYADFFKNESVVRASCDDYRAGAEEDLELQKEDQKAERKLDVEVLVVFSTDYLGSRYDVKAVWEEWMADASKEKLELLGIGGGTGHFFAEEAPDEVAKAVVAFYERFN